MPQDNCGVNLDLLIDAVATLLVYAKRFSNQTEGSGNRSRKKCRKTGWKCAVIF